MPRSSHDKNHDRMVAVERVISELRAGRAIVLSHGAVVRQVSGIEHMPDSLSNARLLLTGARLRRLHLDLPQGGATDAAGLSEQQVLDLAIGRKDIAIPSFTPVSQIERAALDLARLALLLPAVVVQPVQEEGLLQADMTDIAAYRANAMSKVGIVSRAPVPLEGAQDSEFVIFRGGEGMRDQVAIIIGRPDLTGPVPVRLHSACLTGDLFGSLKCDCGDQLRATARAMAEGGGGIILYLDQEGRGTGIGNKMRAYALQAQGHDTFDADEILGFEHDERHFEFAARMLQLLGVSRVRLMTNNPAKVEALRSAGLDVTETLAIQGRLTSQNRNYLQTKRDKGGHLLDLELAARIPE